MKVCVYGAGAIGGWIGHGLAHTGCRVSVVARGTTLDALRRQNQELGGDTVHSKSYHMRDNVIPAMNAVRDVVDRLEKVVPDDVWPLPTYRDMLFVK